MTPIADNTSGTRIGRYTFVREIASGGMATVFLARLTEGGTERDVAIKRLHPHLATEEDFVSMFFDEARLAARIRHRNVVATLEVDDVEGLSIVMEYIEGPTLLELARDHARRGLLLPRPVVVRIALDALAGLHAAHELTDEAGTPLAIVHRDVSPHNILVGIDGITRITDFGIAKASVRLSSTRDGQTKGKLAYMAPEQLVADTLDRRADVFTAGIVLWELFTGRRLFTGSSEARIMQALIQGEIPSARSISADFPEALEAVLMKALARDPAARWATCADFGAALAGVIAPCPSSIVGTLAARAFTASRAQTGSRPSTPPTATPPSNVRRIARRDRDPSLDSTTVEPESDDGDPTRSVAVESTPPDEQTRVRDSALAPSPSTPSAPTDTALPSAPAVGPSPARSRVAIVVIAASLAIIALVAVLARSVPDPVTPPRAASPAVAAPARPTAPPPAPEAPAPEAPAPEAPAPEALAPEAPAPEAPPAVVAQPEPAVERPAAPPVVRVRRRQDIPLARTRDGRLIIR